MSWRPCNEPEFAERGGDVELLIRPRERDLGGFTVRRVLPSPARRMVGPYIFFDHMGPATFPPGEGISVRPHPHIGLSAVTWLFEGVIMHRDSLGYRQPIRPGAVNFMTAGSGIVHSERTPPEESAEGATAHGIQLWLALPSAEEEAAPSFTHYAAKVIPVTETLGPRLSVIIGEAYGLRSPVTAVSPTLYAEALFGEGGELPLPDAYEARAVYMVSGGATIGDSAIGEGEMAVIRPGTAGSIRTEGPARAMLIGGEPFPEDRTIWWNFVSSTEERIERAKEDWREGRFPPVPGDDEFIPLPE